MGLKPHTGKFMRTLQWTNPLLQAQWKQVILGVGRSFEEELGDNSIVRVNGGDQIFSTKTEFTVNEHGYEGITLMSQMCLWVEVFNSL